MRSIESSAELISFPGKIGGWPESFSIPARTSKKRTLTLLPVKVGEPE